MVQTVETYENLVTSEHNDRPNFMAMIAALAEPSVELQNLLEALPEDFDLDVAIGAQLDVVGEWIGRSRELAVPLVGVYFSLDTAGVGLDEGTWFGPFDPVSGLVSLPDDVYRTVLRTVIAANQWDGTIPGAYEVWDTIFSVTGSKIFIVDHQDMTMDVGIFGAPLNAVVIALLTTGVIALKPCGVRINAYFIPSVSETPMFGFDVQNDAISGFDVGSWATIIEPV